MMAEVVGLRGDFVPRDGVPSPACVEEIEKLLVEARAGRLHCLVGAYDTPDGVRWCVIGTAGGFDMIGGIECAKAEIIALVSR